MKKLSAFNKTIAQYLFAVPVLKPAYRILAFLNHHLTRNIDRDQLLSIVCWSKDDESGRVTDELCCKYDITTSQNELSRSVGQKYLRSKYKENIAFYQNKIMHHCIAKPIENDPKIDHKTSKLWTKNKDISSEFEAHACAIKGQEYATKYIKAKRQKWNTSSTCMDTRCMLSESATEGIIHIIASYPMISVRYYLPLRHNVLVKIVYNTLINNKNPSYRKHDLESPEYVHKEGNL